MKTSTWMVGVVGAFLMNVSVSSAQSERYLLMKGGPAEFGWSINRPSKIDGEAEGRALALASVMAQVEGMANLKDFEQFSDVEVTETLNNKFEKIGAILKNDTTYTRSDKKSEAFKGNKRGLVIVVEEDGFKPGTFTNSSDYNKLTGVRKSKASGILLYSFKVYAPDGYDPKDKDEVVAVRYTIENTSGRDIRFEMQPSGKNYKLEAGKTFKGTSYEINGKAPTMKVTDTNRTYKLTAGDHKFFWMKKEDRVGFDREGD